MCLKIAIFPLIDLLNNISGSRVVLYGVELVFCNNLVGCTVKQIALAWTDFTDSSLITADIILGGELTVIVIT